MNGLRRPKIFSTIWMYFSFDPDVSLHLIKWEISGFGTFGAVFRRLGPSNRHVQKTARGHPG